MQGKFIPVLQTGNHRQDHINPLTHFSPAHTSAVTHSSRQVFEKLRPQMSWLNIIGFTTHFFSHIRRVLLSLDQTSSLRNLPLGSQWQLYTEPQLCTQPLEWVYGQIKLKGHSSEPVSPIKMGAVTSGATTARSSPLQRLLTGVLMVSGCVGIETGCVQQLDQAKRILDHAVKIEGIKAAEMPTIVAINTGELSFEQIQSKLQLDDARLVVLQLPVRQQLSADVLRKCSRSINQQLAVKKVEKQPLTPPFMMLFLQQYLCSGGDISIRQAWTTTADVFAQQRISSAIEEYRRMMGQMITAKGNIVPLEWLNGLNRQVAAEVTRRHQQLNPTIAEHHKLVNGIETVHSEIQKQNRFRIVEWGKQIIQEATAQLQQGRENKAISVVRQRGSKAWENITKKTQPYWCPDLMRQVVSFSTEVVFEWGWGAAMTKLGELEEGLKKAEGRKAELENENRDLRRRCGRQEGETNRQLAANKQKVALLEERCRLFQAASNELREQITQTTKSYEQRLTSVEKNNEAQLSILRSKIQSLKESEQFWEKDKVWLESELEKERLLREQAQEHFEELIRNYHSKQETIQQEIMEASRVSEQEMESIRVSSTKELQDWQGATEELRQRVVVCERAVRQKEEELSRVRGQLRGVVQESQLRMEQMQLELTDLVLRNKVLSEREDEYETLRLRVRRADESIARAQKERDQQFEAAQEMARSQAMAEQRASKMSLLVEEEREKLREVVGEFQHLREQKQKVEIELENFNGRSRMAQAVQTSDDWRQGVKAALEWIRNAQQSYNRVRQEQQWCHSLKQKFSTKH